MDCSTDALLQAARCLDCNIPPGAQGSVRSYLLCQWANKPTCDPDALTFINAIGLQDATKQSAVCQLVADLKNTVPATTPGTSFWDRDALIYPMVADGPSYPLAQQGVNLKSPGTFTMVQSVAAPIYSARGIQGVRINNTFLNTQYIIPAAFQDTLRIMWYLDLDSANVNDMYFGAQETVANVRTTAVCTVGLGRPFSYDVNQTPANLAAAAGASPLGAYFTRAIPTDAGHGYSAYGNAATWSVSAGARVSKLPPTNSLYLLAAHVDAGVSLSTDARLSGFSLGSNLSDAERLQYKAIWDTFENALGRGHP